MSMYIINPADKITGVVASSEDTEYPAGFVQDRFRTNPWMAADSAESTLTLSVSAGAAGLGLAYIASPSVDVLIETPGPVVVYDQSHNISALDPNLFVNFGAVASACTITLTFADPGSGVPYLGIARCSDLYEFRNPDGGMIEGLDDSISIKKRYASGAKHYFLRPIVRTFSGQFKADRDSDFYTFMHSIFRTYGETPMFWHIADANGNPWAVFAEADGMPSGRHNHPKRVPTTFKITEVR